MKQSRLRRVSRFLISLLLVLAAGGETRAAESPPAEVPIQMSPYEVSANSVEFQGWRKISSAHFVIYSDAKLREVNQVLQQLEMLHIMAQRYFRRTAIKRSPMIYVLPTSRSDWRKIESKSGAQWRADISDPAHRIVDLIITHYDWQDHGLELVFNEFGRAEMRWLNLPDPLWFQRGIGGFFGAAECRGDTVSLGNPGRKVAFLARGGGWLPWPAVFRVNFQSPEYVRSDYIHRLDGHCTAFVQYLLTRPEPVWVERLMEWVSITHADPNPSETEFTRVFGQDWKKWEQTMDSYMKNGRFRVSALRFPPGSLEIKTTEHTLPVREMRELFVLAQILNQKIPASVAALDKLLAKDLKTEALRELLAEACLRQQRPDAALSEMQKLIAGGTTNPEVHAAAASTLFRSSVPRIGTESRVGGRAEEMRGWCARALELEPRHPEANRDMAWLAVLGEEVSSAQLEAVKQAYHRVAGDSATTAPVAALALGMWRTGDLASARALSQKLVESPYTDPEPRAVAEALLKKMNANSEEK